MSPSYEHAMPLHSVLKTVTGFDDVEDLANKFTLDHLKTYNMEAGVPVAPEGRDKSYALSGDKYSNFNAGKILLILEGIGGYWLLPC